MGKPSTNGSCPHNVTTSRIEGDYKIIYCNNPMCGKEIERIKITK